MAQRWSIFQAFDVPWSLWELPSAYMELPRSQNLKKKCLCVPSGSLLGAPGGGPFVALGPHNPANAAFWEVFFQDVFSALFFEAEGLPLQWSDVAHMLYIVYGLHIALFWA